MNKEEIPIFRWNTKTKEFYVLGHKFDGINSIEDFINYIHNLDKENKSLQSQLKSKEEENQELKLELSVYRQAILEDKEMLGLKEENDKLKKQLEEYENELEKADSITQSCIFNGKKESEISFRKCLNMLEKHKNQQKEFIKYLEDEIYSFELRGTSPEYNFENVLKIILLKYKEIIVDDKQCRL